MALKYEIRLTIGEIDPVQREAMHNHLKRCLRAAVSELALQGDVSRFECRVYDTNVPGFYWPLEDIEEPALSREPRSIFEPDDPAG